MAIVTSRVGLLIDQVLALINATSPAYTVFDGPAPTDQVWTDAVFIGFDADWAGSYQSVLIDQKWAYLGGTSQFEELHLDCAAVAWSGDLAPKGCRDRALAILAGVETVLRTDPTVGMGPAAITALQVGTMFQEPYADGYSCRILFTIHATGFLAS